MKRVRKLAKKATALITAVALTATTMLTGGVGSAAAEETPSPNDLVNAAGVSMPTGYEATQNGSGARYLTTYGVRAGSAGPDALGISNTNYDFINGSATQKTPYAYTYANDVKCDWGIGIWGSAVNEKPNPYIANLLYESYTGATTGTNVATSWMANDDEVSWGDSWDTGGAQVVSQYVPDIVFGANKLGNWNLAATNSSSSNNVYDFTYMAGRVPSGTQFANNDATNIWTQIYTMGQLAQRADTMVSGSSGSLATRYGNASASAVAYEKAIRGNELWIARNIDRGVTTRHKVAYLYAIDGANGKAFFFTPKAGDMLFGNDTGAAAVSSTNSVFGNASATASNANSDYAANNGTVDLGYMATLPFVTDTFDTGDTDSTVGSGIVMKVEDIFKSNPYCVVDSSNASSTLMKDVDVIIFNTNNDLTSGGTSAGKNSSGVVNSGAYSGGLTASAVSTWAAQYGFTGRVVAGDDWGTGKRQSNPTNLAAGHSPRLYCQRNYTSDKNARAAWAFAQVYPELYADENESYAYWVDNVYHVKGQYVDEVVEYMTDATGALSYTKGDPVKYTTAEQANAVTASSSMEQKFAAGYYWWNNSKSQSVWDTYAYYNGSSRGSFYTTKANKDGDAFSSNSARTAARDAAKEATDTIGVFHPTLW